MRRRHRREASFPRRRPAAVELGRRAEVAVADYLAVVGFKLMASNLRLGRLELDLVARHGGLVAVVEVRTRSASSFEGPFESVRWSKRARIRRAVERLWRDRLESMEGVERIRIDVAAVIFERGETQVDYVEGAFDAG